MVIARNWRETAAQVRTDAQRHMDDNPYLPCDNMKRDTRHDVAPLHCRLPRGHRSDDHWHPPLWPGHPGVVWSVDE